ncbi:hypothetical protein ANME2D_03425 [Candidatus Methanoperedens nitroreducens]|uniref:Uncharacterized protein n=1 Tax=Candidatus Methanoperedens nitratireducens TaxID=1392998 RepID=A0A062V3B0_9EURY|nr:hypothetical protein [Candidatus Methanoperedens nitroreducens]KCZ70309.1 hypothetical protein ANME2D_03425 [Candidatus Methanoperedens nitroreducens]MDJ1421347.1 hypothetical protein [Candidatus Methanoperedens sp.]
MQTRIKRYNILLPHIFSRVATDNYYEFSKKFDIGIDLLDGIKADTGEMKGTLGEMSGTLGEVSGTLGEVKGTLTKMNTTLETFVINQDEHNRWMKEHNQRLERILEKLAEK